jgi:hypothetical protein
MYTRAPGADLEAEPQRLQNVKDAAKAIEDKGEQNTADVEKKMRE